MVVSDPNWSICGALDCDSDNQVSDEKSEVLIQNCELGQDDQTSTNRFLWVVNAYLFDFFTYKKIEHSLQTFNLIWLHQWLKTMIENCAWIFMGVDLPEHNAHRMTVSFYFCFCSFSLL